MPFRSSVDGHVRSEIQLKPEQTKGSKARTVLVNSLLQSEIGLYVNTLNVLARNAALITRKTGKRFSANGLCQVMLHIYEKASLDKATSHSSRRTFIATLAHKGVNVRVLAALAGHSSIVTTQRYIDLDHNALRAAPELAT